MNSNDVKQDLTIINQIIYHTVDRFDISFELLHVM